MTMNNEQTFTLSQYLREQTHSWGGGSLFHSNPMEAVIRNVEGLEDDLNKARTEQNRYRMEAESLSDKSMQLATELLMKKDQLDKAVQHNERFESINDAQRKLVIKALDIAYSMLRDDCAESHEVIKLNEAFAVIRNAVL